MRKDKGTSADGWEILQHVLLSNPALKRKVLTQIKIMKERFAEQRRKQSGENLANRGD